MNVSNTLIQITDYIKPFLPIVDSHMVTFITHNLWDTNVPENIRKEATLRNTDDLVNEFFKNKKTVFSVDDDRYSDIRTFINQTRNYYPAAFKDCLNVQEFQNLMSHWGCKSCHVTLDNSFMSNKKSHEVETMSDIVASMAKAFGCSHIVDVGGGKGYLSSVLALEHKMKVLSLDSSSSNTHVAGKRVLKMEKYWYGIRKRIETGYSKRKGKHWKAKTLNEDQEDLLSNEETTISSSDDRRNERGVVDRFYKQATHYVDSDSDLIDLIRENFPDDECSSIALVGLHTCGNLAPSSLKLFLKNIKDVSLLINVSCCYHLLTDKFEPDHSVQDPINEGVGFPMSEFLTSKGFRLSYNTRVLSAQSIERIIEEKKGPSWSVLYRALLEVLIRDKFMLGDTSQPHKVGHIKCNDFVEYTRKAMKKLKVDIEMVDSEIEDLYKKHNDTWNQVRIYFMMRVTLAPVIEAICLLDRLQYLYEQGVEDAYLAQLFDPITSPRCYGIVAFRRQCATI